MHSAPDRVTPDPDAASELAPAEGASVSALLAVLGGALLMLAFFLPTFQGGYWLDDDIAQALGSGVLGELHEAPPAEANEASAELIEAADLEARLDARAAGDEAALNAAVREHTLSPFAFMRFWQLADYRADALDLETSERVAARFAWLSLALIALGGLVAMALAFARRLRPLNAMQVAWSAMFGLLGLLGAIAMSLMTETRQVASTMVGMYDAVGVFALGSGAAIVLISALAGVSRDNWYKVPVAALGWIVLLAAVTGLPLYVLLA